MFAPDYSGFRVAVLKVRRDWSGIFLKKCHIALTPREHVNSGTALVRLQDEALQVFGFRQSQDDRMVGCGTAALQQADAS